MLPFAPARFGNPAAMGRGFVGVLDNYTTSLAAAYLPFRGFGSYDGNGFTIRDTTGDAEQNVGFDTGSGALNAYTVGGNAAIKTWFDQSGNADDLAQATGSLQPLLILNIVNGLPVARLDGVDDIMAATITAAGSARTVYAVGKKRSAQTVSSVEPMLYLDTNLACLCADSGAPGWGYAFNQGFGQVGHVGDPTEWTVLTLKVTDNSTAKLWANNVAGAEFDPYNDGSNGPLRGGLTFGGTQNDYTDADCAAILVYNAAHDDSTRNAIQNILGTAFGLPFVP